MSKLKLPLKLKEDKVNFVGAIPMPEEGRGPTVHFEWSKPYDFPDTGEMTVKFRVKRREERLLENDQKHFEVVLELLELRKLKGGASKPARSFNEAEMALDELRAEQEG
jgi:hypothetical protein